MSSLVILAASVFEDMWKNRQTDRQTNAGENPTRVTAIGISNYQQMFSVGDQ